MEPQAGKSAQGQKVLTVVFTCGECIVDISTAILLYRSLAPTQSEIPSKFQTK